MRGTPRKSRTLATLAVVGAPILAPGSARAQIADWPDVFNPLQLHSLNLEMDPVDWITIQNDDTYTIELPAFFWADGEPQLLVGVRRKKSLGVECGSRVLQGKRKGRRQRVPKWAEVARTDQAQSRKRGR